MGKPTHVMEYTSGSAATMGAGAGPLQFLGPLRAFDGVENWYLTFYALPKGSGTRKSATTPPRSTSKPRAAPTR